MHALFNSFSVIDLLGGGAGDVFFGNQLLIYKHLSERLAALTLVTEGERELSRGQQALLGE